ncbi:MAG: hypothetical protein JO033_22030 [Acidobacteriaceae bacterium]|nr:hypothetical protein [Acidobacteriaceae bacterium]MBV9497750.1 hypothetical protein [Acidobacteriaceae bacterium]
MTTRKPPALAQSNEIVGLLEPENAEWRDSNCTNPTLEQPWRLCARSGSAGTGCFDRRSKVHHTRLFLLAVAGVLASLLLTRFLEGMLFGVSRFDPSAFLSTCAVLVAAAILASFLPAFRAMSVEPIKALPYE